MAGQERSSGNPRIRDIDLPLGLGINRPSKAKRFHPFSASSLLSIGMAMVVVACATGIALRDRGIRMPTASVVSVPVQTAAAQADPAPAPRPSLTDDPAGGAAIIRVNPDDGSAKPTTIIRNTAGTAQDLRVAHLPDRALLEANAGGDLPKRAEDGRRPFDVYARPWSGARGARIALVIGGLGVSQTGTQDAIQKLPPEITLAFASGGNSLARWMQAARQSGHEIVMQVPLEPFDYPSVNPGRATLTVDAPASETVENLQWVLGRTTNYVGVMNYMGARFLGEADAVKVLMAELGKRGLAYVDDGSTARNEAQPLAKASRVPFAASDMQIDAVRERGEILRKLDDLERTARANGFAVGTGSAFDVTVDTVAAWAAEVRRRGVEIVPITAIADDPERR